MTTISVDEGVPKRRLPSLFLRRVRSCGSPSSARWVFVASSGSPSSDDPQSRTISDELPQTERLPTMRTTTCELCGKVFSSVKALHGHMRTHDDRPWRGMRPPSLPSPPPPSPCYPMVGIGWGLKKSRRERKRNRFPSVEESEQSEDLSEMEIEVAQILLTMPETILAREKQTREAEVEVILREKKHICHVCHESFTTGMALGGHMSGHNLETMRRERASTMVKKDSTEVKDEEAKRTEQRHMCRICGMRFWCGQALGGHMRLHYQKPLHGNPSMCSSSSNELPLSVPTTAAAPSSEDAVVAEAGMLVEPTFYVHDFDLNELPECEH